MSQGCFGGFEKVSGDSLVFQVLFRVSQWVLRGFRSVPRGLRDIPETFRGVPESLRGRGVLEGFRVFPWISGGYSSVPEVYAGFQRALRTYVTMAVFY